MMIRMKGLGCVCELSNYSYQVFRDGYICLLLKDRGNLLTWGRSYYLQYYQSVLDKLSSSVNSKVKTPKLQFNGAEKGDAGHTDRREEKPRDAMDLIRSFNISPKQNKS